MTLLYNRKHWKRIHSVFSQDLNKLDYCFITNELIRNSGKTKIIIFRLKKTISIADIENNKSDQCFFLYTYLGLVIDCKLNFKEHIFHA